MDLSSERHEDLCNSTFLNGFDPIDFHGLFDQRVFNIRNQLK